MISKKNFLDKYNISEEEFRETNLKWVDLEKLRTATHTCGYQMFELTE